MTINKILLNLLKLVFSGATALAALSMFCLIYNYTGCHVKNGDGATDYKWEGNQYCSTMEEGFSWLRLDHNGYNNVNDISFEKQPVDILLIGSSHMEAMQVGKKENTGYLLNEYLPEYRTYNIGVSGHNIYTCVQNMEAACEIYAPQKYVILEINCVNLSEESMQQVLNKEFSEIKSYDSGFLYYVQKKVPAIKMLYRAVSEWKDVSTQTAALSHTEQVKDDFCVEEYQDLLYQFLSLASSSLSDNCKLIILYHPNILIGEDGDLVPNDDMQNMYRCAFSNACINNNIIFVDETESFMALYYEENRLANGFVNTAVGEGHLNQYGHQVIASDLSKIISEDIEDL